jgi:hypothetical protein
MGGGGGMSNYFMCQFETLTPEDIALLLPSGTWGNIQTQYDPGYCPEGTAIVTANYGGLLVQHFNTSWQTMIDALNIWCNTYLSPGHYHSFTMTLGFDTSTLMLASQDMNFISLNSNGQQEQMILKALTPSGSVKQTSFY